MTGAGDRSRSREDSELGLPTARVPVMTNGKHILKGALRRRFSAKL